MNDGCYKLSWRERMSFCSGDFAQNIIYQTVSIWLLFFYTNVYGLTPGAAALMFLVVRIIDVIWDPVVGAFIDKSNPRWGKYRSWLILGGLPLADIFNPFDYYQCRTTVCDGVIVSQISIKELKADSYLSQIPIVRKNLQGVNGVELSLQDYAEIKRFVKDRGDDISMFPKLFESQGIDFGDIDIEKDVEEKILIPVLERLGYSEQDWTRQLYQKAGRGLKTIPDFVFLPKGEKHFSSSPFVIEAKYDMSSMQERQNAFSQCLSYARMLRSKVMGFCDKERLVIYKVDENGLSDRNYPIFEDHWTNIYRDEIVGAKLNSIIGREIVKSIMSV